MSPTDPTIAELKPDSVCLAPSYRLPIGLLLLAVLSALVQLWGHVWTSGILALLGLFLLYQTATIRLWLTPTALALYRGDRQLREFPYQDWQYWTIFWPAVPILFYFKEVNSIHFLPVLFDPEALRTHLLARCAQAAPPQAKAQR
ncbi:DUF3119 family protein [Vasconcelosia minhoensis]|uniref:DUF3119 family protein n=1 Tax=Vasconcelosia minhoensis TaxID=3366354 RepID=UPI001D13FD46|nr:DUF3119 family protein [Romeria gracilis]